MSCNFATHVTCLLALKTYNYSELQVSPTTQTLSYKASCKAPLFLIMPMGVATSELVAS